MSDPIVKLWSAPKELMGAGLKFYKRVGKKLVAFEILTDLDKESFVTLCASYSLMMESQEDIVKNGPTIKGVNDVPKKNPSYSTYKMASDIFEKFSKRFYLTPKDREGVQLKKKEVENGKKKYFAIS